MSAMPSPETTADEMSSFGAAWRAWADSTKFNELPEHDRALIRVAFVSGWRARGIANG